MQKSHLNMHLSSSSAATANTSTSASTIVALPPIRCHHHYDLIVVGKNELISPPLTPSPPPPLSSPIHNSSRKDRAATAMIKKKKKKNKRITALWLFFNESRWIPLDLVNHEKLENAIQTKGTFIDIQDSHFPEVKRVRVFPELDYLSYLGIRYKISKVLLPS